MGEYQYFIYTRVKAVIIAVWNATPVTPLCVHFIEKLFNFDPFPSSVPIETSEHIPDAIRDFKRIVRDAFKSDIKRFV